MEDKTEKYVTSSTIRKIYSISNATLVNWANTDKVRTLRLSARGKRIYHAGDVAKALGLPENSSSLPHAFETLTKADYGQRRKVCYARVSSAKQAQDLERQAEGLQEAKPDYEIIKEIGSGINWKRPKFLSLLDAVMCGEVEEIVVTHRDRIARFAFELIFHICKQNDCKIVVLSATVPQGNKRSADRNQEGGFISNSSEQELAEDLIAIITCFTASIHGRRAAENRKRRKLSGASKEEEKETLSSEESEVDGSDNGGRNSYDGEDTSSNTEDSETSSLPEPATKRRAQNVV